ncbi:pre-toxin TG domain-containing protein [Metasolibacillus sp. FSL H7-0170]|uniref:pre-toxin TG domain-containing protein n=1 Tax=Metasolibacillus sp. FSL H7-0170 TaxID=2921431 RepID=UPI003159053B
MGKFWKSIGKAIASIPVVGNAIKSAKKTAQKVKTEVKKVAEKVEAKLTELKESVEELLEEVEESVEEALGKVTTYARKLQNNLDELALVQWVKNDAKSFVLAAYKKTKKWVKGGWREGLSIGVDFIPIVGNLKAGIEAVIGIDPITGRKLSTAERAIAGAAIIGGPLVKGAKHVGKGAMKIIPNSNKLVTSLSKPLAKLKEGGQKVAEKAAAKATELKAQANAMMAQAKQGMRESMDNVGRALRGNELQLAMAGANGAKVGTVKSSDSVVQMSKGESVGSGGTSKGTGNLVFKSDYDNHLINVQGFNRDASKGITGGHNMDEFYNYFRNVEKLDDKDFIHKVTPHPTIDGIIQINYKIPKLDNKGNLTGEYKHFKNPKTVYDPSKISDATIIEWGKDAMQQGIDAGSIVGRKITGINPNGLKFEGYMDANGTITNFYPKLD